ncbi:M16 family metallopeptidase [Dyadobacter arcticus]|uniref:Zinc protease n=1 Tax=Dyadobacter arcticus TaxID=1078754 RepID=A0ABX0UI79_9BACT|nr:pitrilysin family protein [Dyadobacter arcticus]NIJ52646.1 zinc protease [Dyadobacter arcticus]
MQKIIFCCQVLLLVSVIEASAQTKLIEKVTRKGSELVIPYDKYVLSNGLTLIVHEDHSDPLVHVDVTYHVGSGREEVGKSGFAHFFEHMMFQGSDHVADDEHFKIVTESGGDLNGSTNRDRTNYFETVPNNQLERALWLEADRMGFLLDAVTQKKFENQRATVKNERGQNYDNRPYGLVGEYTSKNLYPYGHPYSWLTIGYIEDLNRVDANDLKNFFLRWYSPNNAVLTVGGDVKSGEVAKMAEKYFGSIPRGPAVSKTGVKPAFLESDRYVSYEDQVRFPMLAVTYASVPRYHPDEAPLDALAQILGGGKSSLFYKNFVKSRKAVRASANNPCYELAGEFTFNIQSFPEVSLDSIELILKNTLAEFEKRGVIDDDILQFKATREASIISSLSSVSGKVSQLAQYETFAGTANYLPIELRRYAAVTKEDVMRVYGKYIRNKHAVVLTVYPKGKKEILVHADNYTISQAGYAAPDYGYNGLSYTKAKDSFDRSAKPAPGANPTIKVPPYWTDKLANGVKIIAAKNDEVPTVTMLLALKGGHLLSANDPSKAGIAQLTASMLNEATQKYTAEQINIELEKLGGNIQIYSGKEDIFIMVESPKKALDRVLALIEEKLLHPKFAVEDFDRLKKLQLESIENQATQPVAIASNAFDKLLYGDNIIGVPLLGTAKTVEKIKLEDVKAFYNNYFSPSVANLVVVGDIDQAMLRPKLGFLEKWPAKPVKLPEANIRKNTDKTAIYLIDKEKAAQSEIRIGYLTDLPFDATGDYYKAELANYILGDAFNSRINLNLREDKGYTYGAFSYYRSSLIPGPFTARAGVRATATDSSVVEFMKELSNYGKNGITDEELDFLKNSIGQRDALRYETPESKAFLIYQILEYNLPKNFAEQQSAIVRNITKEEINAIAKKRLPLDNMIISVVGDKASIKPGLEQLGYEVIELDKEGNRITEAKLQAPTKIGSSNGSDPR